MKQIDAGLAVMERWDARRGRGGRGFIGSAGRWRKPRGYIGGRSGRGFGRKGREPMCDYCDLGSLIFSFHFSFLKRV
jgi:hypothetical protein